jgi:hypothetical protein
MPRFAVHTLVVRIRGIVGGLLSRSLARPFALSLSLPPSLSLSLSLSRPHASLALSGFFPADDEMKSSSTTDDETGEEKDVETEKETGQESSQAADTAIPNDSDHDDDADDADKPLSYIEFKNFVLRSLFDKYDPNESGYISAEELKAVAGSHFF